MQLTSDASEKMSDRLQPIVTIPARNEEDRLPRVIAALDRQSWRGAGPLPVVVLINNSTDRSLAVSQMLSKLHRNVRLFVSSMNFDPPLSTVGWARMVVMAQALEMSKHPDSVLILTTDADAEPRPDWIEANLRAAEAGADLITGVIVADICEEQLLGSDLMQRSRTFATYCGVRTRLECMIDPVVHDPWPRHHFEMGGSIAVRGDVYTSVGGLDPLPYREDLAFVAKVRREGYRVRHSVDAVVSVSARLQGRVSEGMSTSLARWKLQAMRGEPLLVEHPAKTIARFWQRRRLRNADKESLQMHLHHAGLDGVVLPACVQAARATAIELLTRDDLDALDVPADTAINELERAIGQLMRTPVTREAANVG